MTKLKVFVKRAYEPAEPGDGTRVLVDRLWPRGVTKEEAAIDQWLKTLAPSAALRKWFGHDPIRWEEFRKRYEAELDAPEPRILLDDLRRQARLGPLTLVFGARDVEHNNAVVLAALISGA